MASSAHLIGSIMNNLEAFRQDILHMSENVQGELFKELFNTSLDILKHNINADLQKMQNTEQTQQEAECNVERQNIENFDQDKQEASSLIYIEENAVCREDGVCDGLVGDGFRFVL